MKILNSESAVVWSHAVFLYIPNGKDVRRARSKQQLKSLTTVLSSNDAALLPEMTQPPPQ